MKNLLSSSKINMQQNLPNLKWLLNSYKLPNSINHKKQI